MTKKEFIDAHRDELVGVVIDALLNQHRGGAELSLAIRMLHGRVIAKLGVMYDQLCPPAANPPQAAPQPQQQPKKAA